MFLSNERERIIIEIGSGWTKVLIGSALGKKKKKGLVHESLTIRDVFYIQTPKAKTPPSMASLDGTRGYTPFFDVLALQEEIKGNLQRRKVKAEKVIMTITDRSVISREMVLPKVEEEKLKGIVGYELQEFLPIDPKQYIIDFKVLETLKVGEIEKYKLNVAALLKEEGQFYHRFIRDMGLEPFALDLTSNGIAKLFDRNITINGKVRDVEQKTMAYIDIGFGNIKLHILEKGVLKFTRNIEGGMQPLSNNQGEKIPDDENTQELVKKWIGSLEQMVKFFTSRESNRKIDQLFIYGGGAMIPQVEKVFEETMGVPAEVINDIDTLDFHKDCQYFSLPIYLNAVASLIRR